MRKKLIVLTTILSLIAFSGVAAATEHDSEDTGDTGDTGDTTFNFGYDEDNGVFIWGSSPSDGETDCSLDDGPLQVTYGSQDGGLLIEDLEGLETGDCQFTAGEVAGPQGQVNHGMFLKTFNAMFDGKARGCMVRHIAQSDLGKGDQQINVPEVEETEETEETEEVTGSVDFETVMTDCLHGSDENGEAEVEGASNGKGRPGWVTEKLADKHGDGEVESNDDSGRRGPPEHARGKGPKG